MRSSCRACNVMQQTPPAKSETTDRLVTELVPSIVPEQHSCLALISDVTSSDTFNVHYPAGRRTAGNRQQQQQQSEVSHCSKMTQKLSLLACTVHQLVHPAKASAMPRTSLSLVKTAGMTGGSLSHLVHCSASIVNIYTYFFFVHSRAPLRLQLYKHHCENART